MSEAACYTLTRRLAVWAATLPAGISMAGMDILPFDEQGSNFEGSGQENGTRFWWARDFMLMLGYEAFDTFEKAINRASKACLTLNIPLSEAIQQCDREIEGRPSRDYKLSRFGCYLVAINGDIKKPQVAAAQAYFITLAEAFRQYLQHDGVERVLIRDDITERERVLSGVANDAGVENYAYFQSAGYRGLYNMNLAKIREMRGIERSRSPLDFMGRTELAANLFRITQTEEKIKNENIFGQIRLEQAAEAVGKTVRSAMLASGGTAPERLPKSQDIREVRKGLKGAHKHIDKPKTKRLTE
jgi:DNA-damage-inducible protein D